MTDDESRDVDPPREDPDGKVLAPEELDITADQNVVELDDGRFLISPSGELPSELPALEETSLFDAEQEAERAGDVPESERTEEVQIAGEVVYHWLQERLAAADSRYGYDITAVFEGDVVHQELFSDDVLTTFENLLVWYAQHVGGDTPVEDVLGILLAESTAPIRLPPDTVEAILEAHDLADTDPISALLEQVRRDGGLRLRDIDD